MRIKKNISLGTLEVDPKEGKIWLNTPSCVLRMKGIDFENIIEKFSCIDIDTCKAIMIKENFNNDKDEDLNIFLLSLVQYLHLKLIDKKPEEQKDFYIKLMKYVTESNL